jgi:HD superfamily phosphodiesterase
MTPIAKKLYQANMQRFNTAKNPLRSHGPDHHLRVYRHALVLAEKSKIAYDDDVLAGAALLHDMAAYYPDQTGDNYHDFDHKIAAEVLTDVSFPDEKVAAVLYAIAHHGSDAQYKNQNEPAEVTLLRDADKLDVFGPIGIARIVMVRTLKGDSLQDIVDDFYMNSHLDRKWLSITSSIAKDMARSDYEYSKEFFAQLHKTLSSTLSAQ